MASYTGTVPANAVADITELLGSLNEFSWRGVSFPVVEFDTELAQDLAHHKLADRDGAHIEGTGRAPLRISAQIPFLNGLDQGTHEHWQRPLYPFTWRKFFEACADKSSGTLQHPELGPLTCKCEVARTRWSGNVRAGVFVHVSWVESDDTTDDLTAALAVPSPLAGLDAFAADLDQGLAVLGANPALLPQPYKPPFSFSDLGRAIRSVVDQSTMMQKSFAGRLDNIVYQANALEFSLNQAGNANSLNWPLTDAAERIKAAAYDAKKALLNTGKPVGFYTTGKDATIPELAAVIPTNMTDLMNLNRAIVVSPLVPAGTVVRYYLPTA